MKKLFIFLTVFSLLGLISCSDDDKGQVEYNGKNAYLFTDDALLLELEAAGDNFIDIPVGVLVKSNVERTFDIEIIDAFTTATTDQYTIGANLVIPANSNRGFIRVTGVYDEVADGDPRRLALRLIAPEMILDGKDIHILTIARACEQNQVFLNFAFDGYASEVSWVVRDASNNVVASGGGYADGQSTATELLCLAFGDYTITVDDSYCDGLSFPSDGSFTITFDGDVLATGGGDYGCSITVPFTVE